MMESKLRYLAGCIDSRGNIRVKKEETLQQYRIDVILTISWRSRDVIPFLAEIFDELGVRFKRRKTIEIYNYEDVRAVLEAASDYLVRYKRISEYMVENYKTNDDLCYQDEDRINRDIKQIENLNMSNWNYLHDDSRNYRDALKMAVQSNVPLNTSYEYISSWFDNNMVFSTSVAIKEDYSLGYSANVSIVVSKKYIDAVTQDSIEMWLRDNNISYRKRLHDKKGIPQGFVINQNEEIIRLVNILGKGLIQRREDAIKFVEDIGPYLLDEKNQYKSKRSFVEFLELLESVSSDAKRGKRKYDSDYFRDKWSI